MKDLINKVERMTSIEIAEVTGKPHNDVLKAIRAMEPAWEKVNGGNFSRVEYKDAKGEMRPCFELTKTECLFAIAKGSAFKRNTISVASQSNVHVYRQPTYLIFPLHHSWS